MRDMSHRQLSLVDGLGQTISDVFKLWMLSFSDYFADITVKCFKNVLDSHKDFVYIELFCLYTLLFDLTTVQQF